jgi:hypothetical protein
MTDYWKWMKADSTRLASLFVAVCVFLGLSIALGEAHRSYNGLIAEVRATFRSQEATRARQFAETKRNVMENRRIYERQTAAGLDQYLELKRMLQAMLDRQEKPAR